MTEREKRRAHLKTIRTHRKYVCKMCFKMGIPWQGLVHDLSKYSKEEFPVYHYYGGTCSPHELARKELGYSPYWCYHKNRNKHHWEFYLDNQDSGDWIPLKIPYKYVIEMCCDMVGAGMAYSKDKWTQDSPWNYWEARCKGKRIMHKESEYLLEKLLWNIKILGLEHFIKWYRHIKKYLEYHYNKGDLQIEDEIISYQMQC